MEAPETLDLLPLVRSLKVLDKKKRLVPFEPNWAQSQILDQVREDFSNGRATRIICLKARQIGISTITEAIIFSKAVLFPNTEAVVASLDTEQAEYLFDMTKRFYDSWAFKKRYPPKYASKRELFMTRINSDINVKTGENPKSFRGRTYTDAHISEIGFWSKPVEAMLAINQGMPPVRGNFQLIESTANGMGNYFEEAYWDAKKGKSEYKAFFFPWFKHYEYIPCAGDGCRDGSCEACEKQARNILARDSEERWLVKNGASKAHLAWRRWAIPNKCMNNLDLFHQEYPSTDEEAFIASGVNAFNLEDLKAVYEPLEPVFGDFIVKSGEVSFIPDPTGPFRIYKAPSEKGPIADKRWGEYFIGADSCQPPGTLVRRVACGHRRSGPVLHEDVPIEDIREGDRVMSFKMTYPGAAIYRPGRLVTEAKKRDYEGHLVTIETARGRRSSYTFDHKCVVRLDAPLADGNFVVYMQRRGDDYRIGRTYWREKSKCGFRTRAVRQGADAAWVLSVHDNEEDAALDEAVLAVRYGIPTWQFRSEGQIYAMPLDRFWDKMGGNYDAARACLVACGRDIRFPLWQSSSEGWSWQVPVLVRASNLLSGMEVLEPDEIRPGQRGYLLARRGCGGWSPGTVSRSWYEGPVYSLHVEDDHTYVGDGIVTHNCYGVIDGDFAAAHVINRRTKEQVATFHGRVSPGEFADKLALLAAYYARNDREAYPTIAVETEGGGIATIERLRSLGYPRIWTRRTFDSQLGHDRSETKLGWSTSWKTKAFMILTLAELVQKGKLTLHDEATFKELRTYSFYGDRGITDRFGPADQERGRDDLVMSLAITMVCESQEAPLGAYEVVETPGGIIWPKERDEEDEW